MIILAIETSCDDTAVACLKCDKSQIKILADFVSSQTAIHSPFGGVVPHLAARLHARNLPFLLENVLSKINVKKIDLVAVTVGPGLEPSLWAGIKMARVLSLSLNKPIIGVNHLEGHIAANWLSLSSVSNIKFPAVCLIVSGGHTQLVLMRDFGKYKILGQTRDDAAGEAFDKVANYFRLGYPGGPAIAQAGQKGSSTAFNLPRPMLNSLDYDFSFSGLKTAVLYLKKKLENNFDTRKYAFQKRKNSPARNFYSRESLTLVAARPTMPVRDSRVLERHISSFKISPQNISDICASFQQAVIDVLIAKTIRASQEYQTKTVLLGGGVAANKALRQQMKQALKSQIPNPQFLVPDSRFCTDNAGMIGLAGWWQEQRKGADKIDKIVPQANLNF